MHNLGFLSAIQCSEQLPLGCVCVCIHRFQSSKWKTGWGIVKVSARATIITTNPTCVSVFSRYLHVTYSDIVISIRKHSVWRHSPNLFFSIKCLSASFFLSHSSIHHCDVSKDVQTSFISLWFVVLNLHVGHGWDVCEGASIWSSGDTALFPSSLDAPPRLQLGAILMALFGKLAA